MELFKLHFTGFLTLFFCLVVLRSSSAWDLNRKIPSTPPTNTQTPSRKPKTFFHLPRIERKNKFKRLIYLKHLLQLNCLSEICREMHSKLPEQKKSEGIMKQISVVRNKNNKIYDQSLILSNTRQNKHNESLYRNRYPANGRIILLPSNHYLNQPISQRNSSFPVKPKEKEGPLSQQNYNIKHTREKAQSTESRPPEEKLIIQNKTVFTNNNKNSRADTFPDEKFELTEKFDVIRLTTATSHPFRLQTTPNSLGQYEVREIIEENKTNNYINFKNFTTGQLVAANILKEDVRNNSITDNMTTSKPNNEVNTTATALHFKITSTQRFRDFFEKSGEVQLQVNREELKKHFRVMPSQSSNNWKPSTFAPRKIGNQNVNFGYKTDTNLENLRGVPQNPLDSFTAYYFDRSDFYDDLEHKTTITIQKPESRRVFPSTKRFITGIIPQQTAATVSKQPPILSVAPVEIQTKTTLKEYLTTKPRDLPEQPKDSRNYRLNTSTPPSTRETVQYFKETISEAELTTPDFEEYLDYPLIFDLIKTIITDSKKDHEKNSRKMHFGQESWRTTKPTFSNPNEAEQRRSDILIDENFVDYIDDEHQLSALNYLEKLKQNSSNLTTDSIVPFIPEIINDLRENKLSDGGITILSNAFGKYWETVLFLANNTNLDMLPLLKMKNEKDLNNFLQSLALERLIITTTEKIENEINSYFNFDLYDYMERYEN